MFQLSLTKKEVVRSKRFMAILMIPIFIIQMSSLNLFLLQIAIAEDGESVEAAKIELADDPPKDVDEEVLAEEKEKIESKVSEIEAIKEEPKVEEVEIDKKETLPSVDEIVKDDSNPSVPVDLILDDSLPIVGDKKDSDIPQEESLKSDDEGEKRITPEAAYDEVEASAPVVQEIKVEEGWRENSDGSSSIMVTAGNEYGYKDSGLKIKFTRIDNGTGEITVKEIELTVEQVEKLGALSNKAWDITSNMADGTFEYELTLPVEEDVDESKIQLVYAEEKEDLNNEEKIKTVEKEDVKVDDEKNELTANGLDHFTIYLVKEKLSNESLAKVFSSGSTITDRCMDDLYPGNLVCSANDIDIADVTGIMINDDGCAFPGDTVTFTANWNVEASANERYDVGLYFSTDGDPNNDGAYTGSCSITTLPNSPTPPWFDFDGDFCGDASSSANVTPTIQQTVQCLDTDGDNKLNLPYCTSWRQNDDDVCSSPLDAFPGAPSKCNCDKGFEIPITVPYGAYIEVVKDLIPSNDGGKFNLQIDGANKKIDASDSGTTGKVSVGAGTSASPGAIHTVGEASGTGTVLSDYASSISCVDRGLGTFDGGAPLIFSGTGPLNVDVDKDDDIVCTITNSLQQASLTLVKTVTNNNGGTALPIAWTLSASGPTSISGVTGSASITNAPVDIGTYTLSESAGPTGYVASNYSCVKNGGAAVEGNSITLAAGDNATCTINNDDQSGALIVKKIVVNDNGGTKVAADFKFSVDGGAETPFEIDGQNDLTVSAGTYDIVESPVSGYTTTYNNCTDIVVPSGGSATCTITNNDQPASLTVIKHVINDNGGTATAGNFTMNVTGTNVSDSSFPGAESPGTTVTLNAGNFNVDENAFSGYTKTIGNNCFGTIANGENKICTITNDDQPGTLIVKKEITNDNGGNNVCKDFSFNYGTGVIAFEEDCQNEFSVPAGTYTVSEIAAAGYETIYENCTNISVPNGGSATCTVKNNDTAPSLSVIKKIINDNGGNETVDAFEIKMNDSALSFGAGFPNGETTTYTSSPIVLANTSYILSEKDLSGYIEGTWSCKTVTGVPVPHPVTLTEGQNVICEITNDDIAPSIKLIKDLVNNNGGTVGVNSFGLSIGGTAVSSGQVYPVKANTAYALNEAGLSGYEFVSITGEGCPANLGESVILDEGENITCTIKNDDKPGKLTVIKIVDNKFGGDLKSEDFTINVSGVNPSQTGFPGSSTGTLVTLDAGSFNVTENLIDGYVPKYSGDCSGIINIGDNKVCTITNEDQAPKLTLVKTVINNNGGTKQVSDFPLFVGSTQVASGVAVTLESNVEYTVSETNLTGYSASAWSGDCSADGKITLNPGDNKICYITNDDIEPKLTVTKIVNNSNYGNLTVADFPLYVNGTHVISGEQNGFNAGNYMVSEMNKPGYSALISGDCGANGGVTLNPGDVKSCTITNTDNLGKIIIEKQTLPDGDSKLFTFSGDVSGSIADGGTLEKVVAPGNYNVSETVPSGWDLTSVICDDANSGASVAVSATANINVEANETVKCTFTNTKRSSITILKNAINNNAQDFEFINNFGNNNPATFYLDDDSNATLPNTRTFEVLPGEYEVSEEEISGWQQESATCDNGETIDSINIEPGENVTCTFVNEEYAKIILVKNTIGGNDTFEFDATGPTPISGAGGVSSGLTFSAGTYILSESVGPANYTPSAWFCTGDVTNSNNSITLDLGQSATCEITNDDIDSIPTIEVTKTAIPTFVPETGGDVEYTFVVKNLSAVEPVNIISLTDSVFGTLDGDADCQVGTSLAAGASCEFSITRLISGDYPGNHLNVFTAEAKDDEDNSATDNDDAIVDYTDVLPDITVTKDANPTEIPETGGDVKFTYTVTNNSTEAGTITGLADDKFGPLTGDDDCKVGTVLASKASCSFEVTFNVPAGNAAGTHVDVFKATVTDGDGNDDTATDDATVTYIGANITLDPLLATNNINDPHTFTATVMENPGNGWIAASGELVTFTLVNNTAGASFVNGNTCTTDVNGKCMIQINSTSPGTVEISGAVDVRLLNFTLHRETDGTLGSSVNAVKTYEAGKIIVEKQTLPDGSEQSFKFDPSWSDTNFNLTDGQSNDSGWLAPGIYNVSEVSLDGWDLTNAVCTASSDPTHSFDPRVDGFILVAGDTVTCVFTNTQKASVDVYKFNDINGNGTHDEDEPYLSNWEMEMTEVEGESYKQITGDNGYTTFALEPAEYNLSETIQDGWVQSGIYCEEDNREGTLITATGEAYGHHGNCSGWNGCGDAATCAQWACEVNGYEKVFSFGDQKPCTEFGNCNLFNYRGSVQKNWGNWCEVMGVTDIYCGNSADDDSSDYRSVAVFDLGADNNYSLAVDPGDSKNCYVGNFQKGDVTVWKYEDTDGVLGRTEGQEFWLGDPTFTFRLYEDIGEGWQFLSEKDTNNEGKAQFEDVFDSIGSYFVCEVKKDGWENMQSLFNPANNQSGAADEYSVCKEVNVSSSGYNADVEFGNARYADIHGYKWEDLNGNRERDCEFNERTANGFSSNILCEGEKLLSGWTINLYRGIGDGLFETDPYKTMQTSDSEEHFGWYWFEHLLPGEYKVCEVLQKGWNQTYPSGDGENCHIVNLPDGNSNGFNESQNAVWGPEYNFGNQFINPELTILKYNNQWPTIQSPGNVIDYTIKVEASENNVNDVIVTDLPPEGFKYINGSWSASSSLGEGHIGNLKLDHIYASPGVWDLGDMQPGEVITLSYKAQIEGVQQPGTYNDLAWADGADDRSQRVLAGSVQAPTIDDGVISDNFVGTQIALAVAPNPQNVELEEDEKIETKTKKRVLGVTTYLPATGTPNFWLVLGILALVLGAGLILISRRRINNSKNMLNKIVIVFILGAGIALGVGINEAKAQIAPAIRLAQPDTPTNIKNQEIAFVVLDIEKRAVTVDCYKKGPGELVADKFSTVSLSAGGSSGVCKITLDGDGVYEFSATASADGQSSNSKTVSLVLNTMIPGTPRNYNRNGGSCSVSFTTADDGGLTSKVVMYRSKNTEFIADDSNKISEGNFGSNVDGVLTDPNENCGDYYYVIRALSEGGIGSGFVGDEDVDTETRTRTRTIRNETIVRTGGAIPIAEGEITEGAEAGATEEVQEGGAVQGEETTGEVVEGAESEGRVAGVFDGKNKFWWIIGLIAILTAIYYGYQKSKRKNRIPLDEE